MGTAGTPPACAQCETGYAPPRDCQALSLTGIPSCSRVLQGYPRDTLAKVLGFGGATPSAPWVRWRRTYSDEEGLPQCRRCPGDKNYTIVKVCLCARFS